MGLVRPESFRGQVAPRKRGRLLKSSPLFLYMKIEVYILTSPLAGLYYIGYTKDLTNRLEMHRNGTFQGSFTSKENDWDLFFHVECESICQARRIEKHIKKMKSRKYIENLLKYSEISFKLLQRYK